MKKYKYHIFTSKIEEAIEQGILKTGDALPAVRTIKDTYQLSTSSVQSGYDYLVFKGLVTSIPRLGYRVASNLKNANATPSCNLPAIPRDAVFY